MVCFMAICITMTIFTDKMVKISQMLPECKVVCQVPWSHLRPLCRLYHDVQVRTKIHHNRPASHPVPYTSTYTEHCVARENWLSFQTPPGCPLYSSFQLLFIFLSLPICSFHSTLSLFTPLITSLSTVSLPLATLSLYSSNYPSFHCIPPSSHSLLSSMPIFVFFLCPLPCLLSLSPCAAH